MDAQLRILQMSKVLHIIEPTLFDQTGHGYSYVHSLINANKSIGFVIHVWLDKRGKKLLRGLPCISHAYFFRALRRLQKFLLYFRLLRQDGIIFVSTCELFDLQLLAFYHKHFTSKARIALHFHQFKQTEKKLAILRKLAIECKQFSIMTPTDKLTQIFREHGFKKCYTIPCPSFYPERDVTNISGKFSRVLYAGAARSDKGFPAVVDFLEYLRNNNSNLVFEVQASPPNSQRYDEGTTKALQKLQGISTSNLILHRNTLNQQQYLALFNDAICLLLYDQTAYNDKFSGIALDAFYAGCPIITIKNTWMGDTVEKYNAGIALSDYSNQSIAQALQTVIDNYEQYHNNAKHAAGILRKLHDPRNTLTCIRDQTRQILPY